MTCKRGEPRNLGSSTTVPCRRKQLPSRDPRNSRETANRTRVPGRFQRNVNWTRLLRLPLSLRMRLSCWSFFIFCGSPFLTLATLVATTPRLSSLRATGFLGEVFPFEDRSAGLGDEVCNENSMKAAPRQRHSGGNYPFAWSTEFGVGIRNDSVCAAIPVEWRQRPEGLSYLLSLSLSLCLLVAHFFFRGYFRGMVVGAKRWHPFFVGH